MFGDRKSEKSMSMICPALTTAKIRYFERAAIDKARTWLQGN